MNVKSLVELEPAIIDRNSFTIGFSLSTTSGVVPLRKASIPYLEIIDDIAHIGNTGTVVFNVPDNLLSKINAISIDNSGPTIFNIFIRQNDLDILNLTEDEKHISISTQLQRSKQTTANTTDTPFTFTFEETVISDLKQEYITPDHISLGSLGDNIINVVTRNKTQNYNEEVRLQTSGIIPSDKVINSIEDSDSYYDYLVRLTRSAIYSDSGPAHIHLTNYKDDRVVELYSLGEEVKEVCNKIDQKDFSGISEIFTTSVNSTVGSTGPMMRENAIDIYNFELPDYMTLLDNKWINFRVMSSTRSGTSLGSASYNDLYEEFRDKICGGREPALPKPSEQLAKRKYKTYLSEYGVVNDNNIIKNAIFKSFMFDNTSISFRVPGMSARQSGRFIIINNVDGSSFNTELSGLWYIVSVKHLFEQELYTNEIIATRFVTLNTGT
jgi:hypothetical protein